MQKEHKNVTIISAPGGYSTDTNVFCYSGEYFKGGSGAIELHSRSIVNTSKGLLPRIPFGQDTAPFYNSKTEKSLTTGVWNDSSPFAF